VGEDVGRVALDGAADDGRSPRLVPAPPQQSADGLDDMKGPELRGILHMAGLPITGTTLSTLINRIRKHRKSPLAPPPRGRPKRQRV